MCKEESVLLLERAGELAGEIGVALAALLNEARQLRRDGRRACVCAFAGSQRHADQGGGLVVGEWRRRDTFDQFIATEVVERGSEWMLAVDLAIAIGRHEQNRTL